jgi:hypothetical protein
MTALHTNGIQLRRDQSALTAAGQPASHIDVARALLGHVAFTASEQPR